MKGRSLFMAVAFLLLFAGQSFAEPVVLKLATVEPPQAHNVQQVWGPYFDKINKEGEGIIKIEVHAGGTLGRNPKDYIKLLKNGVIDISHIINAYFQAGRLADDQVVGTPFTANDCFECSMAVNDMQERKLLGGYDDLVVLAQVCISQYAIHTDFPVKVPSDLKGKKLRTAGKMFHAMAKAFGAAPVAIPVTKVAESINRGVVDGTLQDWTGMDVFRINDVAKYHCDFPYGTNLLSLAMTKKKYNSLSPKAKAILDKYMGAPFTRYWAEKLNDRIKSIKTKIKNDPNHKLYTPTDNEMKQWKAVMNPVVTSWGNKFEGWDKLLSGYKDGLKKARNIER